jgi:hypothetical protein
MKIVKKSQKKSNVAIDSRHKNMIEQAMKKVFTVDDRGQLQLDTSHMTERQIEELKDKFLEQWNGGRDRKQMIIL